VIDGEFLFIGDDDEAKGSCLLETVDLLGHATRQMLVACEVNDC
jgi:hypothetical protein